ncbi:MAG TPA: bifunctional methylenetetrahydrofolate dehydrogenase/methenyltetrahydrofolate cyclohydrolase FolD [Steroidobacteraceae bacterium]|jgi:methylenetetrahydrofolate dehydrogenase (NADP+)/methenyltetrahydrofolate cyclohydrolase|nr:bifunctional methylenetetrahydrofolate dehydrogenase/methenyltetrahydrofolate cyclohydrolase FolD [Steroidobacteraceae bacterium]
MSETINGPARARSASGEAAARPARAPSGAVVMDGVAVAAKVRQEVELQAREFAVRRGRAPGLAVIQVGEERASSVYVRNKRKSCLEAGIESFAYDLPERTGEAQLLALIGELNRDERVDGILVQLPLPGGLGVNRIMDAIDPAKDVDGFHPVNTGLLTQRRPKLRPCTPYGVIRLAQEYGIALPGVKATVVGDSNIVGRPMAFELLNAEATVTICHIRTRDLQAEVERAELLVSAVGKAGVIHGDWIRPGAAVFDVGINWGPNGKLVGDVEFERAAARAGWITPVPGGLGPMTIAMLLSNTVEAAFDRAGLR